MFRLFITAVFYPVDMPLPLVRSPSGLPVGDWGLLPVLNALSAMGHLGGGRGALHLTHIGMSELRDTWVSHGWVPAGVGIIKYKKTLPNSIQSR